MTKLTPFILASASPRREQLLVNIGFKPAQIIAADIDETPHTKEEPIAYAKRMATEKCEAIAALHPQDIILAADTVVACGKRILAKAEDEKTARECLKLLSGRRHRVITAVAVHAAGKITCKAEMTVVQFSRLTDDDANHYIASSEWQGKAGGYGVQGYAGAFISQIVGSYTNVVGLPLFETRNLLMAST